SETVTKKYDDFTTYYRIANGKDIQVSESDIVYSKDELDNLLNIKSSKDVFSQIDDKIRTLPINLIKSIKNRSGLYVASKENQVEIYNPKVLIKYNSSAKEDVGANYLYKAKFTFAIDDVYLPIYLYSFVPKERLVQNVVKSDNTNQLNNSNIIQRQSNLTNRNISLEKDNTNKNKVIKDAELFNDINLLQNYKPILNAVKVNFDFGLLLLHSYVLSISVGLGFFIYALIIFFTTISLLRWNERTKNKHFYILVKKIKENKFRQV
ncbi:MAG: hypothetical protein LBM02_02730, partial [Lachnospiraceae bacterium]|nr:hypothetical protein [Lachnospiraceae bacterium]